MSIVIEKQRKPSTLGLVYLFFVYLAYRNQSKFYQALGRENEGVFLGDIWSVMFYFHVRNKMREELQGFR